MRTVTWLALAVVSFVVIATANSGGYRYGASDQAFYVPAIALRANSVLFPRDRALLEPQMRLWLGDEILGGIARLTGVSLPTEFALLYLITMVLLAIAAIVLARRFGCSWWTVAAFLILLTLRHRIAKTGANSLEGYFHPRMLSFAIGLLAIAEVAAQRFSRAAVFVALAALVHTTTALWFAAAVGAAWLHAWTESLGLGWRSRTGPIVGVLGLAAIAMTFTRTISPVMDDAWLAVLGDKDYLFPANWPVYAWVTNLLAPLVIGFTYRVRQRRGVAAHGEGSVAAGLLFLVLAFAASLLPTERHVALAVQLQTNRVFWLLDSVAVLYLAWWLTAGTAALRRPLARQIVIGVLLAAAIGRGFYVLRIETDRPLVAWNLPDNDWTDAMRWLRTRPSAWHVLADPGHAYKFGSSVRVAALRDTLVETGKDTALAMYDRPAAIRVAERLQATADFEGMTLDDVRRLRERFQVDVMVDRTDRVFPLRVLYRNSSFVIYDLR